MLVVDDEPNNRLLLAAILEFGGHQFSEAGDAAEALRVATAMPPDLVIVDLHMPGMSGTDLIAALRATPSLARVPVALYTATPSDESLAQFVQDSGISGIIPKPSEPRAVLDAVESILKSC